MPNWIRNNITICEDTETVLNLLSEIKPDVLDDTNELIDFNKIVPMPKDLDIECGSVTDDGIEICLSAMNPDNELSIKGITKMEKTAFDILACDLDNERNYLRFRTKLTEADIERITEFVSLEKFIALGKKAIENMRRYGSSDRYHWCVKNWGTRWNACSSFYIKSDDGDVTGIGFDTAWDTPEPIVQILSLRYQDIEFQVCYADEDIGHNCGRYSYKNGELIDEYYPESPNEAKEYACNVWGYDDDYDD